MPKFRDGKEIDFTISVADKKYTFIYYKDGSSEALRYGEKWRDTTGDNLIHALAATAYDLAQLNIVNADRLEKLAATIRSEESPRMLPEDLVEDVRRRQVRAGEQAVIDNLDAMGLARKIVGKE